jgi:hypothetical protein
VLEDEMQGAGGLGQHDVRDEDGHGDEGAGQQLVRVVALAGQERADARRRFTGERSVGASRERVSRERGKRERRRRK